MGKYLDLAKRALAKEAGAEAPENETRKLSPGLAPCGSPDCGGCYEVESGRRIHPPKSSEEWLEWLARWQPGEKDRGQ